MATLTKVNPDSKEEPQGSHPPVIERLNFISDAHNIQDWSIFSTQVCYVSHLEKQAPLDVRNHRMTKELFHSTTRVKMKGDNNQGLYTSRTKHDKNQEPYKGVTGNIQYASEGEPVNNRQAISISYLGRKTQKGTSDKIYLPLDPECKTKGTFPDGSICDILVDTGASTAMISEQFVNKHSWLSKLPKFKSAKPTAIKIADGMEYWIKFLIQFVITINDHHFEVLALIVPMTTSIQLIIGYKSLVELEASVDTSGAQVVAQTRCLPCIVSESVILPPKAKEKVSIMISPITEYTGQVVFKLLLKGRVHSKLVQFYKNLAIVTVRNNTGYTLDLVQGQSFGIIDLRSIGYYHVALKTMSHLLTPRYEFESMGNLLDLVFAKTIPARDPETEEQYPGETSSLGSHVGTEKEITPFVHNSAERVTPRRRREDPYPWLDKDDPRRTKTDSELIREGINMDESVLEPEELDEFYRITERYREAFSLRDEIGLCPSLKVHLYLKDNAPFFIRPYPIKQGERQFIDKEVQRLVQLGVLKQGLSSYTSPIMLIPRKNSTIPRMVTDFRHLNTRLVKLNVAFPLVRDIVQELGDSKIEVVSVVDLRDAYHTLRLDETSKQYCGIIPYYGADSFLYQRLGMGLAVSPAIWQTFINYILANIKEKGHHVAIMDDCLIHSLRKDHMRHLVALFQALIEQGLKISPRKCQFFRDKILYMGSTLHIDPGGLSITPFRTRVDAIDNLETPTTVKDCRMICGMVNYLAHFLPNLRTILLPIYELTKKKNKFEWGERQEQAFKEVKRLVTTHPILSVPNSRDRFQLYSDTSHVGTGGALYQIQEGIPKLVGYSSKKLLPAVKRYSITELELYGLIINIKSFKHYLSRVEFDVIVDHSAIPFIMRAKHEPPTDRLKKLLRDVSNFAFKTYYRKGKDMVLCDFLSRYPHKEDNVSKEVTPCYAMETRSSLKKAGLALPRVEDMPLPTRQGVVTVPKTVPINPQPTSQVEPDPVTTIPSQPAMRDEHIEPVTQPPPELSKEVAPATGPNRPSLSPSTPDLSSFRPRELVFPQLSPFIKTGGPGSIEPEPHLVPPDKRLYLKTNLKLRPTESAVVKHLPRQDNIDRLLKTLQKRHILDSEMPLTLKELQNAYLHCPDFKDIYKYLLTNFATGDKAKQQQIRNAAEDFTLADNILYRITTDDNGDIALKLAVPDQFRDWLIHVYHDSLLGGHQGVSKTFGKLKDKFHVPRLYERLRLYKLACQACQITQKPRDPHRAFVPRIPTQYMPMSFVSCDVKYMPRTRDGYEYMIVFTCEITGYVQAAPLKQRTSQHLAEALMTCLVWQFGPPQILIYDEDRAMSSTLMESLYKQLKISTKLISPYNHGSLKTERYIQSLSNMIIKYLERTGDQWPTYLRPLTYALNISVNSVTGFSPFEMVYARKPPSPGMLNLTPLDDVTTTYQDYQASLINRLRKIGEVVLQQRTTQQNMRNQFKPTEGFQKGQLVYLLSPNTSHLITNRTKFNVQFVGPLAIAHVIDRHHYALMDISGKLLNGIFHYMRLKEAHVRTPKGNVDTLADLKANGVLAAPRVGPQASLPEDIVSQLQNQVTPVLQGCSMMKYAPVWPDPPDRNVCAG